MKKFLLLTTILAALSFTGTSHAAIEVGEGDTPVGAPAPPGGGETCDFQKFKEDLGARESGGRYGIKNSYGYLGKYQFGKSAPIDLGYRTQNGGWTGKDGVNSESDFLNNPQAQENAMNQWSDQMNREIESAGLTKYIGQNIGGCTVTRSGLMAGRHLKGIGCALNEAKTGCRNGKGTLALRAFLESGGSINKTDAYGTSVGEYVCKFSGYNTPYDNGQTAGATCGGGSPYTGAPGAGKGPTSDPDGDGGFVEKLRPSLLIDGIRENWIAGLMLMAEQFTANMAKQLEGIGMAFDAKDQLETQRLLQQKQAEAHKDYQPSEQMCTFGTFARDLAATDRRADLTRTAVSQEMIQRELGAGDSKGTTGPADSLSRLKMFRDNFCNPGDSANGLKLLCPVAAPPERQNLDIDYTRTLDMPLTLDINLTDDDVTPDEQAIFSLVDYLFMHTPMPRIPKSLMDQQRYQYQYMNMRSIIAMRGIARNSFSNIIALKSASPEHDHNAGPYLKALIKEMGLDDDEIEKILGKNPSYYAQMEFLTKTIYQNPSFYANLYDKPANVARIRAAMRAIKLMHDRDINASLLRREMLLSMLLELRVREKAEQVYSTTESAIFRED